MGDIKDLPPIPESAGELARPLRSMREALQTLMGHRSDVDKAAVRWRDLIDKGAFTSNRQYVGEGGPITIISPPYGGVGAGTPDLTPPPTVTGLSAVGGFTNIIVSWTGVGYTEGHGNKQTRIYAVKKDTSDPTMGTFPGEPGLVATAPNPLTLISLASELNTRWHLWAKFESNTWPTGASDGVLSSSPAGGTNGVIVETGLDVDQLLEVLEGQIKLGQLYVSLAEQVQGIAERIDGLSSDTLSALISHHKGRKTTGAQIYTTKNRLESADLVLAQKVEVVSAGLDSANALIVGEQIARAQADDALAANILLVEADVDANSAAILVEQTARADADTALASDITTLQADVGDNSAAISAEAIARAALDGSVQALYTVRAQVTEGGKTVVGGFGLSATSTAAGGPEIEFGVRADRFWVGAPAGTTDVDDVLPFVIQATDDTVNGVLIPKGVYMDAAYIKNLSALVARLGSAWIDNAMIANLSAAKLTAGDGTVGGDLKSTNFVTGNSGWRIRPDGTSEFSSGVFRGSIYASAGTIGGVTIGANYIQSDDYVAGTTGWRLTPTSAQLPATTIIGEITNVQIAAGAVTSTKISVPNLSSISADIGTVTAGTLNAVTLTAVTGTFNSLTFGTTGYLNTGKSSWADTTAGFYVEANSGSPRLIVGNADAYMRWSVAGGLEIYQPTITEAPGPASVMGDHFVDESYLNGTGTSKTVIAGVEFRDNGTIYAYQGNSADGYAYSQIGNWYLPTTADIGDDYVIFFTEVTGSAYLTNPAPVPGGASLSFNTQIQMSRTWYAVSTHTASGAYTIKTTGGETVGGGQWVLTIGQEF